MQISKLDSARISLSQSSYMKRYFVLIYAVSLWIWTSKKVDIKLLLQTSNRIVES